MFSGLEVYSGFSRGEPSEQAFFGLLMWKFADVLVC